MKRSVSSSKLKKKRQTLMKKLRNIGPVMTGSLAKIKHKSCNHTIHLLTFKDEGKTKSVYVPVDMVKEIEEWLRNHKKMKDCIRQISDVNMGIIRRHVTEKKEEKKRLKRLKA